MAEDRIAEAVGVASTESDRIAIDQRETARVEERVIDAAVVADGVCKRFMLNGEPFMALEGVDITVPVGRFLSLVGPSGCGKSTLLRILADVIAPTSGSVSVFGASPDEARRKKQFGFVFQDPVLLPWRTALSNTELPLQLAGRDRKERRQKAMELLSLVGLEGFEHSLPSALSGGMARRVAIARALTLDPRILFLDEPFAGLDEIRRQQMNEELQRIWMETGTTALLVTHNVAEAVLLSDEVAVMAGGPGRIIGSAQVPLERPRTVNRMLDTDFVDIQREVNRQLATASGMPEA